MSLESQLIAVESRPRAECSWTARFWIMLGAVLAVRLAYLAAFPCDLSGDETYYWEWGRQLSFGYFSKPPLIAWIMALANYTGGGTAYGIRVWATIFGGGATIAAFYLGKLLYDERVGFWSAAVASAIPGMAILSIFMTIDAPLVFLWTASLCLFHISINSEDIRKRALGAAGLMLALGLGHLCKQMMWLFPPMCVMFLALHGEKGREKLRIPGLWIALFGSYLFLIPTIVWNAKHGWITFIHTSHHFKGDGLASFPHNLGDFAGMQIGLLSPIVAITVFGIAAISIASWKKITARERFLAVFGAAPLAVMLLMTLRQQLNGNWAAAFYPALIVLTVGRLHETGPKGSEIPASFKRWFKAGVILAAICTVVLYALPAAIHKTGLEGARPDLRGKYRGVEKIFVSGGVSIIGDPLARFRGWKDFAESVQKTRQTLPEQNAPIILVGHRYGASALAFYLPDKPRVFHWTAPGEIESQYEIWDGLENMAGRNVFIVSTVEGGYLPESLRACLSGSTPKGIVSIDIGNGRKIQAGLYWSGYIGHSATAK